MDSKRRPKSTLPAFMKVRAQEFSIQVNPFPLEQKEQISESDCKFKRSFSSSDSSESDHSSEEDLNKPKENFSLNDSKRESSMLKITQNDQLISPLSQSQSRNPKNKTFINPSIKKLKEKSILDTPEYLKEFKYRRKSQFTFVKEGPNNEYKEIHQMSQFAYVNSRENSARSSGTSVGTAQSSRSLKAEENILFNQRDEIFQKEGFESQANPGSYLISDSTDEDDDENLKNNPLRRKLKRVFKVAYFLGILFSLKNRVKVYGALRSVDNVKDFYVKKNNQMTGKNFFPLLPSDTFVVIWTIIMIVLLFMIALCIPYMVSFIEDGNSFFNKIDLAFAIGLGIDLIINFSIAYQDPIQGTVIDLKAISIHYLKTWFLIDFLSIFPLDLLTNIGSNQNKQLNSSFPFSKWLRLLKILRLFKLLKFSALTKNLNKITRKLNLNTGFVNLIRVLVNILFLNHIIGCIWFFMARVDEFGPDTWVTRCELLDKEPFEQYLASYYWSFQALTTVGYGDIPPKTLLERTFANVWMILGVGFYSFAIGNLSTILANINRKESVLKHKITAFNNFAGKVKLPESLRHKIQRFFELNHKENVYHWMDPHENLNELPSNLKTSLLLYSYYGMIKNIKLLQMDANFTASLLTRLKLMKIKKGETLYREGDPAEEVYFISKGAVKLVNEYGQNIFAFAEGNYFGEIEAISDEKRLSFCQATEATILLLCEREYFIEALQDFPLIEMQIKSIAQNRRQKLEEKIACLKEKVETQGQEDEFHQKKLLNSTEYLNKVVAKSFMKKRREKLLKKSNTSQILPKIDLNTTTFSRRNFRESSLFSPQEPTTTLNKVISAPLKSFNNALETVNEEKVRVTTPGFGIHLFCDKEERSLTSISGSKPKGKALLTYKKEEKIGLSRQEACDQKILKSHIEETSRSQQEEEGKKNKGNDPISQRENDPLIKKSQKYELNNWLVPLVKNKNQKQPQNSLLSNLQIFRSKSENKMDSLVEAKEDSKSASVVFNNEKLNSIDANNNIEENKIEKSKFNLGNLVHLLTDIKPTGEKLKRETQEIYLEGADDDTSIQEILDEY